MKIKIRDARLSQANMRKLALVNDIIEQYQVAGYVLTLRQLYYQLVSQDIVPNNAKEYKKLGELLKEGRMGGLVDWDAIEDRLRKPDKPSSFDSPAEILDAAISQYQLPRQEGQPVYVEVWVEKDALSGVLTRVTRPYHIPIMVNRGYTSASAMYDAYNRFLENGQDRPVVILYLGDFDPSGLDMIRDIRDRTDEFMHAEDSRLWAGDMEFTVEPIALTREQIEQYNPPPNPTKITDSRAGDYIARYGRTSWEVDALRPDVLNAVLDTAIRRHIDIDQYDEVVAREKADRAKLRKLKEQL